MVHDYEQELSLVVDVKKMTSVEDGINKDHLTCPHLGKHQMMCQ